MCHMSGVMCQVSRVRYHVWHVWCQVPLFSLFWQRAEACWWRVRYKRGLHWYPRNPKLLSQKILVSWYPEWVNCKGFLQPKSIHWTKNLKLAIGRNPKSEEKKTPHFSKICPRELSFHTIHLYKILYKIHLVY